ncbi:MAG TPA: isoprenylcysteine carboxylmethyltransferase family protein [Allosphingosinicella sp.]|nr:isoprenylcysteine carboxylmethyltransferase family protein [Allosphingosinicella sp.]
MTPQLAAILLWLLFLLSWHAAMLWTARTVSRERMWLQTLYFAGFVIGFCLLFMRPEWWGQRAAHHPPVWLRPLWDGPSALAWALVAAQLAGFAFAWWARAHLGRLWSGGMTIREDHKVVDTGPYRLVRHPIYTGFIAAILAYALLKASPAALAGGAILTLVMAVKAKAEERFLRRALGAEAYDSYGKRTPMLLPFGPV